MVYTVGVVDWLWKGGAAELTDAESEEAEEGYWVRAQSPTQRSWLWGFHCTVCELV